MPPPRTRPLVHTLPALNIQNLHREGVLLTGNILTLSWPRLGKACDVSVLPDRLIVARPCGRREVIEIVWRNGTLGGRYPSVQCSNCGLSAATLYDHSGTFACRVCTPVAYACQSENRYARTLRRVGKLRERLGWERGAISPDGVRPYYMNQGTYVRLSEQIGALTEEALATTVQRLRRVVKGPLGSCPAGRVG